MSQTRDQLIAQAQAYERKAAECSTSNPALSKLYREKAAECRKTAAELTKQETQK